MKKERMFKKAIGFIGLLYLLNLGAGIIEFIPDNLPFVGNVDEASIAVLVDEYLFDGFFNKILPGKK
jgi:hypothetical protein